MHCAVKIDEEEVKVITAIVDNKDLADEPNKRFYETDRAVNMASSEQVHQPIYTKALNFWCNFDSQLGELKEILEPLFGKESL